MIEDQTLLGRAASLEDIGNAAVFCGLRLGPKRDGGDRQRKLRRAGRLVPLRCTRRRSATAWPLPPEWTCLAVPVLAPKWTTSDRPPSLTGRYRRTCTSLAGCPVLSRDPRSGVRRQARSSNAAQGPTPRHEAEAGRSANQARVLQGTALDAGEARRRGGARLPPQTGMTDPQTARLDQLREEANYHRQRLDLYRARLYGGRAADLARLEEFQRASDTAAERLRRARDDASPALPPDQP